MSTIAICRLTIPQSTSVDITRLHAIIRAMGGVYGTNRLKRGRRKAALITMRSDTVEANARIAAECGCQLTEE
jgi:hypothetical protein